MSQTSGVIESSCAVSCRLTVPGPSRGGNHDGSDRTEVRGNESGECYPDLRPSFPTDGRENVQKRPISPMSPRNGFRLALVRGVSGCRCTV